MEYHLKIYAIRHNITNRVYVGSSKNVDIRLRKHMNDLRAHKHCVEDMQEDFDKYGEDYTFTILEDIYQYSDKHKEYEWMEKYQSHIRGIGYNYKDTVWNRPNRTPKYMLTLNNKTMPIAEWSVLIGVPYEVIYKRVNILNWDIERALTTPVGKRGRYVNRERKRVNRTDSK